MVVWGRFELAVWLMKEREAFFEGESEEAEEMRPVS